MRLKKQPKAYSLKTFFISKAIHINVLSLFSDSLNLLKTPIL